MIATATLAAAQEPEHPEPTDETELAKATQNPVSDLVSVPFQFNFYSGGGLDDRSLINLNIQPVVPIEVASNWNVVARMIAPIVNVPDAGGNGETGLGDLQTQLYLSPSGASSFVWGVGPVFSLPTATLDSFATGSWGLGPAGVGLVITGPWVVGALVTQTWTVADYGDDTKVNQFLVQPFVNFNFSKGWALSSSPIITANWEAESNNTWTVPVGGGLSYTTKIGSQALSLGASYFRHVEHPTGAAQNQLRISVAFLFPTKPPPGAKKVAAAPTP